MDFSFASQLKHPVFKVLAQYAAKESIEVYVIGGWVRDLLLEIPSKDIDILVIGDGPKLANAVAQLLKVKKVSVFKNYGTAHFRYKDLDVEFVGAQRNPIKLILENHLLKVVHSKTTKIVGILLLIPWRLA